MKRFVRWTFWLSTAAIAVGLVIPGVMNLTGAEGAVNALQHLGYPLYFGRLLGVAKLLAAIALIAPVSRVIKEWAYAGVVFTMIAATASHAASGDAAGEVIAPAGVLAL